MDIEAIAENIDQGKCILVLGPDIVFNSEKSLLKNLGNFLETKNVKCQFHDDEEMFSSATKFKRDVFRNLPKYFGALQANEMQQKIAEIPFHLIISLSPDLLLKKVFDEKGYDYSYDFYHKGKAAREIKKTSKEKPLIYNLMGEYTQNTSLVLCFNHLFDYLSSVFGEYKLDAELLYELGEANTIFFLGFKYDKWYFKLIMRLLNKDDEVHRQASFKEVENNEAIFNFYTEEFKFNFEKELGGIEIIDQLYNHFAGKESLRKPKPKDETKAQSNTTEINVNKSKKVIILNDVKAGNINIKK